MSDDLNVNIGFETDQQSINRAKRTLETFEDSIAKPFDTLEKSAKQAVDSANKELAKLKSPNIDAGSGNSRNRSQRGSGAVGSSEQLSNVTEATGTLDTFFATFGQTQLADVFAFSEQFGIIGQEAGVAGGAMGSFATVLGAGAVAIGAIIAVGELYNFVIKDQTQATKDFIEATKTLTELQASAADTSEAESALERTRDNLAAQRDELARLEERYTNTYSDLNAVQKVFNDGEQELFDRRKEVEGQIRVLVESERQLVDAIGEGQFAEQDRIASILDGAAAARESAELAAEIAELDREGIEQRIEALDASRNAIQAEIDALRDSGDTSFEVTQRLEELDGEMSNLDSQSQQLTSALNSVSEAASDTTDSLLNQADLAGELAALEIELQDLDAEGIQRKIDQIEKNRASLEAELAVLQASGNASEEVTSKIAALSQELGNLDTTASKLNEALADAPKKANEDAKKERKKASNDRARAAAQRERERQREIKRLQQEQQRAYEAQLKAQQDFQNTLEDTILEFGRTSEDLIASGDFLGFFQAQEDFAASIRQLNRETGQANVLNNNQQDNRNATFNFNGLGMDQLRDAVVPLVNEQLVQTVVIN